MKNYGKLISVIAVLIGLFVMSVSVSAADLAIIVVDGKAVVGNGTSGVAIVASYDEDGKLTKVVKEYVTESSSTVLNVKNGDKVMYWDGLETMNPLSDAVTVTDVISDEDKETIYEAAVDKALREALGKNKGKDMTELQKALALHDWLVMNCQYDVTVSRPNAHTAYGAIVEDPSISPAKPPGTGDRLIERWSSKESVRNQIEYDALCTQYAAEDVDALVELISEVQSSTADAVRLGKEQIPIEIIKERFRQLTQMHVAYVLDSLRTTTTQINNIKAYLLTALYNAPTTMGFFYSAQVRHDFGRK